ncbi:MAG: TolC family protein [Deltaproteobacteria bacterium]
MTSSLLAALVAAAPLTMQSAVEEALSSSPELKAATHKSASARAAVDQASSAYLPRVSVQAQYIARAPKNQLPIELPPIPGLEPVGDIDDIHHVNADLVLGYRVLDLSRGARADAAEAKVQAARADTETAKAQLAFGVRANFLAALYARDVEKIATASLVVAESDAKRIALRTEAGVESDVALAQARVRVAELSAQLARAKNERRRYAEQLMVLLGRDAPPEVTGDLAALAAGTKLPELDSNPRLTKARHERSAALSMAKSASRGIVPTVDVFGTIGVAYPRALQLELGPVYTFGVKLEWLAFDGGLRSAQADGFEENAAAVEAMSDATRRELLRRLAQVEAKEATARADLESASRTLDETKIYLRVAKTAVSAGTGTELDVHTAELGLDRARMAMKKAELDIALAQAERLFVHGVAVQTSGSHP